MTRGTDERLIENDVIILTAVLRSAVVISDTGDHKNVCPTPIHYP